MLMWRRPGIKAALTFILLAVCQTFALAVVSGGQKKELDLTGDKKWQDTGIFVEPGDTLQVTATGSLHYPSYQESGPDGMPRGWRDLLRIFPLSDANHGALIGRIGDEAAQPFLIGATHEAKAASRGRFYLGLNQTDNEQPEGKFHVTVTYTPRKSAPPSVDPSKLPVPTQEMVDEIPTRVVDSLGNPGDRVNFLIVASEEKVKQALHDAGWVEVDRKVTDAIIQGALATLSRQAYTQLPMSELRLFGRPQDYGFAHADPLMVVAARHHFRIWKTPLQVNGQTLWAGAGTHDIGLERDKRNGGLTHKIDPDTDQEREYIVSSIQDTGEGARTVYMTPSQPVMDAKTATGRSFHSDGRTAVIILNPEPPPSAAEKSHG